MIRPMEKLTHKFIRILSVGLLLTLICVSLVCCGQKPSAEVVCFKGADSCAVIYGTHTALIGISNAEDAEEIVSYLTSKGVYEIEYIVLSNITNDRAGGLERIMESFTVDRLITPYELSYESENDALVLALCDSHLVEPESIIGSTSFGIGEAKLRIFASEELEGEDATLVTRCELNGKSFLFANGASLPRIKEHLKLDKSEYNVVVCPVNEAGIELVNNLNTDYGVVADSASELSKHLEAFKIKELQSNSTHVFDCGGRKLKIDN